MIWLWIAAAVLMSMLFCSGKKIAWQHYIWILLPIEMYGLDVAGAVIKPYMLFGVLLFINIVLSGRRLECPAILFLFAFLMFGSDVLTGFIVASVKQHLMFMVVVVVAWLYIQKCDRKIQLDDINHVTVAMLLGYGIVFLAAYVVLNVWGNVADIRTSNRYDIGMFLRIINGGIYSTRLRGFCIDPNTVIATLVPGAAFALWNILYAHRDTGKNIVAVSVFIGTVILTDSRMGFICMILMGSILFWNGYRTSINKSRWIIAIIFLALFLVGYVIVSGNSILNRARETAQSIYSTRSGLTDTYGRLSIWKTNMQYMMESSRIWIGVGQNQIASLTTLGRDCHNTWLEWICGIGLFAGMFMNICFLSVPFTASRRLIKQGREVSINAMPLLVAYCVVLVCITSVDNITNSTLLFLMMLFRYSRIEARDGVYG